MVEFVKRLGELIGGTQALVVSEICLIVVAICLCIMWKITIITMPSKEQLIKEEKRRCKYIYAQKVATVYMFIKEMMKKEEE